MLSTLGALAGCSNRARLIVRDAGQNFTQQILSKLRLSTDCFICSVHAVYKAFRMR
jgi:hypothetical protein